MTTRRTFLGAVVAASAGAVALPGAARAASAFNPAFPKGFLWGAATAAYQVEGNNVNSDVWAMEHAQPTV
jgi:beta-glucosidase